MAVRKIAHFTFYSVDHELCHECPHFQTCKQVCMAMEVLVQLAFKEDPEEIVEGVNNVRGLLDLENSIKAN